MFRYPTLMIFLILIAAFMVYAITSMIIHPV